MAILYIGGEAMPSPSKLRVEFDTVGDTSSRNALGKRLVDVVAVKRVISLEWARLGLDELVLLMEAVAGDTFFTASYPDPDTGAQRSAVCRAVERSASVYRVISGIPEWSDVSMKWEEQ